jgi:hypothetical protein
MLWQRHLHYRPGGALLVRAAVGWRENGRWPSIARWQQISPRIRRRPPTVRRFGRRTKLTSSLGFARRSAAEGCGSASSSDSVAGSLLDVKALSPDPAKG